MIFLSSHLLLMLLIPVFHLFFLDLVEGFGMSDFEEAVLNPSLKPHSMSHCLPLLHKPKYLIRAHSHFILMRAAIRPCSSSINSTGDVQNQIMQLLHYSGIIWLSGAVLVSHDLITRSHWRTIRGWELISALLFLSESNSCETDLIRGPATQMVWL